MKSLPDLPCQTRADDAIRAGARERRAVDRAIAIWEHLARGELPGAAELGGAVSGLRPRTPPSLDEQSIDRLSILSEVAELTGQPVAFEGWSYPENEPATMVRAALLPARAINGTVAVTAVFGAASLIALLPAEG